MNVDIVWNIGFNDMHLELKAQANLPIVPRVGDEIDLGVKNGFSTWIEYTGGPPDMSRHQEIKFPKFPVVASVKLSPDSPGIIIELEEADHRSRWPVEDSYTREIKTKMNDWVKSFKKIKFTLAEK